jgi:spore germination protein KC
MNRKWLFLFLVVIGTTLTSGCWNKRELNELAIVSALAIDKNEEGNYVATFQVINPGNIAGGLQGGSGGQGPPISVYTATGDNVIEMDRRASAKISRDLYYAHTGLLVISEELAKEEGITTIFDAFKRSNEFRTTTRVVIARDIKAGDLVKSLTAIDKIPAEKVVKTLESTEELQGEHINVNIREVTQSLAALGKNPLISGFSLKGDAEKGRKMENVQSSELDAYLEADGIGVFKKGKLIDWLDGETARGTLWVLDRIKTTEVNMEWENEKKAIVYLVIRQNTNVSAQMKKGKPKILVKVRAEGDIREIKVPVDLSNPHVLQDIEKELEKELQKEIEDAVLHAQKNKSDILGFGEAVHQSHPKEWKKIEKDWHDVSFPELEVDVKVDAFIRRTGLRNKTYPD